MRVYLAARYSENARMRLVREKLSHFNMWTTSRWIDCRTDISGDYSSSFTVEFLNTNPEKCTEIAKRDLEDIHMADTLIMFTCGSKGKGGRQVELGYALALGKRIVIIGQRENVFHTLDKVEQYDSLSDFLLVEFGM